MDISTARLFSTGEFRQAETHRADVVLGGSPKRVRAAAEDFRFWVSSWTWTSRPMTGSYLARTSGLMATFALEWDFA